MPWLVDTCIWVDIERKRIAREDMERYTGDEPACVSPVTIAEFSIGVETGEDADSRGRRAAALARLRKEPCLVIDQGTAMAYGVLAGLLRRENRLREHRIQDLWIASLAVQHGFKLLTRNGKDFEDLPGLQLVVFEDAVRG
jgi:predicted nucleic acid-binding protein